MTDKEMNDVYERVEVIKNCDKNIYDGLSFQEVVGLMKKGNEDISFCYETLFNGMISVNILYDNGHNRASYILSMFDSVAVADYMVCVLYDLV